MILELSDAVIKICEKNYADNCHNCPLRAHCVVPVGTGASALNRWVETLNQQKRRNYEKKHQGTQTKKTF